jgi:hypothetical protein
MRKIVENEKVIQVEIGRESLGDGAIKIPFERGIPEREFADYEGKLKEIEELVNKYGKSGELDIFIEKARDLVNRCKRRGIIYLKMIASEKKVYKSELMEEMKKFGIPVKGRLTGVKAGITKHLLNAGIINDRREANKFHDSFMDEKGRYYVLANEGYRESLKMAAEEKIEGWK